jgi:hypothetical protein
VQHPPDAHTFYFPYLLSADEARDWRPRAQQRFREEVEESANDAHGYQWISIKDIFENRHQGLPFCSWVSKFLWQWGRPTPARGGGAGGGGGLARGVMVERRRSTIEDVLYRQADARDRGVGGGFATGGGSFFDHPHGKEINEAEEVMFAGDGGKGINFVGGGGGAAAAAAAAGAGVPGPDQYDYSAYGGYEAYMAQAVAAEREEFAGVGGQSEQQEGFFPPRPPTAPPLAAQLPELFRQLSGLAREDLITPSIKDLAKQRLIDGSGEKGTEVDPRAVADVTSLVQRMRQREGGGGDPLLRISQVESLLLDEVQLLVNDFPDEASFGPNTPHGYGTSSV